MATFDRLIITMKSIDMYIVHDSSLVFPFSNLSAYLAYLKSDLLTQRCSRKSCSPAGGFVPTRSHRAGVSVLVAIRV